jgi:hypothetical protein
VVPTVVPGVVPGVMVVPGSRRLPRSTAACVLAAWAPLRLTKLAPIAANSITKTIVREATILC